MFHDRGILDALYMLDAVEPLSSETITSHVDDYSYNKRAFIFPPWREIYRMDSERDQDFQESIEVYEGLREWYTRWGYEMLEVPRLDVNDRAAFILRTVESLLENGHCDLD